MGKWLFILAALLVLTLPVLLAPFGADIPSYRTDAVSPLEDRLALRTAAITGYSRLLSLAGESGSPQVIVGKDGFLFFAETLEDYQGTAPLTEAQTHALTGKLLTLESMLAEQGQELIVLIAPNKNTIYPEMMPAHILPARQDALAEINTALTAAGLRVLDAGTLLRSSKEAGLLYFKGDTHWNARGARLVFQELMRMTGKDAPEEFTYASGQAGDLALLCQPGTQPVEQDAVPEIQRVYRTARPMRSLNDARIQTSGGTTDLALLVVRDSFGEGLFPYLANTAGSMVFSRSYQDIPAQAETAKAHFVVLEVVQRNLRDWLEDGALIP